LLFYVYHLLLNIVCVKSLVYKFYVRIILKKEISKKDSKELYIKLFCFNNKTNKKVLIMKISRREAKKMKRNRMLIGAITIFVMLGGGLGIFASNIGLNENSVPYNDLVFEMTQNGWMFKIDKERVFFPYHPLEIENINVEDNLISKIENTNNIYLSFNPNSEYAEYISSAQYYLSENLALNGKNVFHGFNIETAYDVPIIECNSEVDGLVIIFEEGEENKIFFDECLIVNSNTDQGFLMGSTRLVMGLMNII
jgi:hypothetical protein